ncbi:MAG: redoxin domain-containing protein [Chloroflexota bacterium]|nr:MAG: redoxin domain-containing protein [Chloroflexota bacterium]
MQPRVTVCSICHSPMPPGQQICNNCGTMLCPHCREPLPQRSRFCPKCGFLCITEQQGSTIPSPTPAASARPQAIPTPRVSNAKPQPSSQPAMDQQSSGVPVTQLRRNCPKCGTSIDLELGRCSGCGLMYGTSQRVIQQQAAQTAPPARPPITPRPQISIGQQPTVAQGMGPQYSTPKHSPLPPTPGQRQHYGSPGAMPPGGMQMPIPRATPAAASATSMSQPSPATPYPYQAAPTLPGERRGPDSGKRGFPGIISIFFVLIVCILIGGGIYYFLTQRETTPPPDITTDYTPPSIQNVSISSTTETSATIKWATDEPATSKVKYGITEEYGSQTAEDANLSTSHSVTLTGLNPNTTYHFQAISTDAAGNEATEEGELITAATADETPPTISGVNASSITESSATITWATDETATSQVEYGETEEYGSQTAEDTTLSTSHSVTLTGLNEGTTYYYRAISKDSSGNVATSANQTFETTTAIPVGSQVGDRAPDFTVQDLAGQDVDVKLSDYQGKIVMINFWAVWCNPCLDELPYIQAVSDNWSSEDLAILAIASGENETIDTVNQFIVDEGYNFPTFYDYEGQAKSLYSIPQWPTTFFIDAEGIIKYIQIGSFADQVEIEIRLNAL